MKEKIRDSFFLLTNGVMGDSFTGGQCWQVYGHSSFALRWVFIGFDGGFFVLKYDKVLIDQYP